MDVGLVAAEDVVKIVGMVVHAEPASGARAAPAVDWALVATIVGVVVAVLFGTIAACQGSRRHQRDREPAEPPPASPGTTVDQRGQQVHGSQVVAGGDVSQVNVVEIKLAYERVRLPAENPDQLAQARALLCSLPTDALPDHGPLPAGSRMPLAPNPLFVGRSQELLQLAAALHDGGTVALGQVVAATGLGGLGKTQLAVEFVHRWGRFFAGGVFWLSFASAPEIPLQVAASAGPGAMGLAVGVEGLSQEERLELVMGAWRSGLPRLLVFDNCEEETLLEAWRPPGGGCRVLVTSRRSRWAPTLGVRTLPLDLLPRADSVELLRRYRPELGADDPGLSAIAHELGDLPLALHLAGSYLRTYRAQVSLDEYLAQVRRPEVIEHASLLGRGQEDTPSPTHHVQSLAQTFAVSVSRLDQERDVDRVAVALLARMGCLAPGEPVPHHLLDASLKDVDPLRRADGVRRLGNLGLVEEGQGWLRLHRLLAQFVRREDADCNAQAAMDRALNEWGRAATEGHLSSAELAAVIPHLVHVAGEAGEGLDEGEREAELSEAAGRALHHIADLGAAQPWYEQALAIRERVLGPEHPGTATSLSLLAGLRRSQGASAAARPLLERALAIRERVLGPEHPDTAKSLNLLAGLLRYDGELDAARPLFERALSIRERVLGPDHCDTAWSLNSLARLLRSQGELAAARRLYERALAIFERALGPDHTDTADILNNLASLLKAQGDLDAARPLFERALGIRERVLGPDHPLTASSLNNLASLLKAQGDLDAARPLFERALAIREKALGPDHPRTAHIRRNRDNRDKLPQ